MSVRLLMVMIVAGCADLVEDEEDTDAAGDQEERTLDVASNDESEDDESDAGNGDDAAGAGEDSSVDIGAVLSLSGQNATYGDPQRQGIELALTDLEAAEGPEGDFVFGELPGRRRRCRDWRRTIQRAHRGRC